MKAIKERSNVTVKIAGQSHQIRWDKAALFELGQFAEATAPIDEENAAALWRRACIYLFAMLRGEHPYKSPKDIAGAVADDEAEELMAAINKAIMGSSGDKDGSIDPLSESGPSPDAD